MKTLYKNIYNGNDARKKQIELQKKTGLKLTCYHTGNGYNFRPYLDNDVISDNKIVNNIKKYIPYNSTGKSFTQLADETGYSIIEILEACQWLYKNKIVSGDISRDGKIIGIHFIKNSF